jgi:multicomponent Na+:H+ antiporter subunit A
MIALLVAFAAVSIVLPALVRVLGRGVFLIAAIVPFSALAYSLAAAPTIVAGGVISESYAWIPELQLSFGVRLDVLSWALSLVVTGVGGLVLVYCARYFRANEVGLGRFTGILLAFSGAMYGLIIADDVYFLFIMWEATSVLSYLLIGHYTGRKESRGAALQALLVTTLGGLVMLVGFVLRLLLIRPAGYSV